MLVLKKLFPNFGVDVEDLELLVELLLDVLPLPLHRIVWLVPAAHFGYSRCVAQKPPRDVFSRLDA